MYIVTVIPLAKGLLKENFSYFSSVEISLGSIVSVPIRSKNVDALVVNIKDARDLKSDLKRADYQLKKIEKIKGELPFMKDFFRACARMRNYTVGSTGTIIRNLIPSLFLENIFSLEKPDTYIEKISDENIKNEKLIFQAVREDRVSFYRTLIREAFAQKKSIFICVPTRYDTEQWKSALTKGIEQYVFTFHSDISKKTLTKSYNECITEKHPILIIGTGMFLSIPRQDIATIIIESESSDSYKQFAKPYLDIRSFAEVLSSINKAKFILADTLLRPETLYRHDTGELGEVSSPLFRLPNTRQQKVIDMKEEVNEKGIKKFTVLSTETKNVLEKAIDSGESIFLFSVRKGLAGVTVCNDCGTIWAK